VALHLTRMAGGSQGLETVEDVARLLAEIVADLATKVVFVNVALCDFRGVVGDERDCHKHGPRLSTRGGPVPTQMGLRPLPKLIGTVRRHRKDIFLVGFKHTSGASPDEQYVAGLHLVKEASCNLVLANDAVSRRNMVVTPEEARYHVTTDRDEALRGLVEMAYLRSHLTFTRSTVVAGEPVPWGSPLVPDSLREVVNHCVRRGAYKPFRGATAGHFAVKLDGNTFLTSRRKTDFNDLASVGLVRVVTDGPDSVIAYGSKPSVGGQSQRVVFQDHPDYDCIVHFHCPIKPGSEVPQVSQREYECGSHECGQNTSRGLRRFGGLSAVYLREHGPNVVFHRSIDPQEVINFIEGNFDLSEKTGGYVSTREGLNTPSTLETFLDLTRGGSGRVERQQSAELGRP
jgi:hypothetical protein